MLREKIIFLSAKNPSSTEGWSGIPYFMYRSLQDHYEVIYVKSPTLRYIKLVGYYINKVLTSVGLGKIMFDYGYVVAFISGLINSKRIGRCEREHGPIKFIFSPSGSTDVSFVNTKIPVVNYTDCSMLQLVGYYPALSKVMSFSKSIVGAVEKKAFRKGKANLFSSAWAADFVTREFSIKNASVVPFGANLSKDHPRAGHNDMKASKCTLIFVGVDWERKGGDIALKIREQLEASGIDCTLIIVGSVPPGIPENGKIEIVRNLVKHKQEDDYARLFHGADFMILPTLADCSPIVIAESFAFGVPVLATNTGGIMYMIDDQKNGFLINERSPSAFVSVIEKTLPDMEKRKAMASACRTSYLNTYNWNKWAADVAASIE